jgi:hypothetical protein
MRPGDGFELLIEFGESEMRALSKSRSRLVLVRPFSGWVPDIVWVACEPEPLTRITWHDVYGIYAGSIPSRCGDPAAAKFTVYPASDRTIHHFLGIAFGTPEPAAQLGAGRYGVVNHTPFQYAFGLMQRVTVNGIARTSPVNWSVVPGGRDAEFMRSETLHLWTQPDAAPGQLIAKSPARRLALSFDAGEPIRRCRFDAATETLTDGWAPS